MAITSQESSTSAEPARAEPERGADPRPLQLVWWLATPFLTGLVIMALELVAFRLYAPYFGYSIYVWGGMISVVMVALALGYAIGGWMADRSQTDKSLYGVLLFAAFYQLGILFTLGSLLRFFAHRGEFSGAVLASLIIFAPPMTAMATAGPFLIRLLAHSGRVGSTAGRIYALSTVGGIAGILATSFFLVPHFGTQKTLETICIVSALTALAGLAMRLPAALLALVPLSALLWSVPTTLWPANTLWAVESPYNLVRVVRNGRWLILKLNDERGVHTIRDERTGWTGHYYDDFALGPLLVPAQRLLVLGMGGGSSIVSTRVTAPDIDTDAVEIDPRVVEAASRFFGLKLEDPKLRVHIADARPWLASNSDHYDLVHLDLYQGGPYIPFYLVTVEFFQAMHAHMRDNSLLMMNVFDTGRNHELLASTAATLERVFPTVIDLAVGSGNHLLLASPQPGSALAMKTKLESYQGNDVVQRMARRAAAQMADFVAPPGTLVFTDDFAPVEEMTHRMLEGE